MNKIYCLHCNKELLVREGKKKLIRKYCDVICARRYIASKHYKVNKDKKEYRERAKDKFKEWYSNNKERQKKSILRNYRNNKEVWNERKFTDRHKKNIKKFINPFCSCGKPIKIIFHKQFGNRPVLFQRDKGNLDLLEKYTKDNLIGFCSKTCLENYKYLEKLIKEDKNETIKNRNKSR